MRNMIYAIINRSKLVKTPIIFCIAKPIKRQTISLDFVNLAWWTCADMATNGFYTKA